MNASTYESTTSPRGPAWVRRVQREGLYAMIAVVLATLWGLIASVSMKQQERLLESSARELVQLNGAVAQHTAALLDQASSHLRLLDHWLQARDPADAMGRAPAHDRAFAALVDEMRRTSGGLVELHALTAGGRLLALPSREGGPSAAPAAQADLRHALPAAAAAQPAIGAPVELAGRPTLPVGWRLAAPVGPIHALVATIDLQRLNALHERMRLKPEGSIMLMRLDGLTLWRTPFDARYIGRDMRGSSFFRTEYGARPRGSFVTDSAATDGVPRLVSYERLDAHPVTVLVTRRLDEVLGQYRERRLVVIGIAAVLSVLLVGFTWALRRSVRELHRTRGELRVQATTDELTHTMNRRALFEAAAREFERARRYGRPMAVLMLDADHFKAINDRHGHAGGDAVLHHLGALWQSMLRSQDLLGRIGGEEFCIVLVETGAQAAGQVAERLRQGAAAARIPLPDTHRARVTASIGWTVVRPTDRDWPAALARADRALYQAKADGRNCVRSEGVDHAEVWRAEDASEATPA